MNVPLLQARPVPPRPHRTEPVSREETDWLASAEPQTKDEESYRNGQEALGKVRNLWLPPLPARCHGTYG